MYHVITFDTPFSEHVYLHAIVIIYFHAAYDFA